MTIFSITIWADSSDDLTFQWRETGNWFMCYLLLPSVPGLPLMNNWGRFPLFDVETASAALAIMADIQTDADTTPDLDERAQYKRINIGQACRPDSV